MTSFKNINKRISVEIKKIKTFFFLNFFSKNPFKKIYLSNYWNNSESRSGPGSTIQITKNLRKELLKFIKIYSINNIVDIPCGDFNWMKLLLRETNISYTGLDIVSEIIDLNCKSFSSKKIKFYLSDIRNDPLPECDFLFNRDCLFHLSNSDILKSLKNINNCKFKYFATSNHSGFLNEVRDIKTGDFKYLNFSQYPFNFSEKPFYIINDNNGHVSRKEIHIYTKEQFNKIMYDVLSRRS